MDSSPSQFRASFEDLADAVASAGLVAGDDLGPLLLAANRDSQELARLCLAKGLLTAFQLSALSAGRGAELRIGNYEILDRLGAGGMGTVFKARHRRMKRVVALKVLSTNLSENEVFVKRFQREVETIACLGHPNVVMAYDADEAEVGHFLVMEFVDGLDLAACVAREGTFSLSRTVDCVLQAARGLAYAHSQGVIHRDVKPHNLLRDKNGVVKVTDLGLARLNHGAEGPAAGADVTMAGGVIGTADYMPPEQAVDSTTIDHRADIYSLGCTIYFLLAGKPPYVAPTLMSVLLKHREAEIPALGAVQPNAPAQLDDLFRRMLAKRPEQRPQRMSEVVSELEAIAKTIGLDELPSENASATVDFSAGVGLPSGSTISTTRLPDQTIALENKVPDVTVLVVEPSRVQASIIKQYLQDHSLPVVGAVGTGNEALEAVRRLSPRVVISAMHLSDIPGVDLAGQIRSEIKTNAPGFILITSEQDDAGSASLSKLNRVMLLQKPFAADQLAEAISLVTGASAPLPSARTCARASWRPPVRIARSQQRVLIVDDSSTARVHERRVLEGLGFSQFVEVGDGAHAIAVAAREAFHLIVTDYNMPLMDGRALVSYLKQNPSTAAIPIVMVTSETDPRVLDSVRQLGVIAVLDKSFSANFVGPLVDQLN